MAKASTGPPSCTSPQEPTMYVCTFVLSSLAPFFRIGVTTASFHTDGKVLIAIDVLISLVIEVINNWVGG